MHHVLRAPLTPRQSQSTGWDGGVCRGWQWSMFPGLLVQDSLVCWTNSAHIGPSPLPSLAQALLCRAKTQQAATASEEGEAGNRCVWRCSPFLPVLLPGFVTPQARRPQLLCPACVGRDFPSQQLTHAIHGSTAGMCGLVAAPCTLRAVVPPGPSAQRAGEAACTLAPVQGISLAFAVPGAEEQDEAKERAEPLVPSAPLHHSTDHGDGCTWAWNNIQGSGQPWHWGGAHH